MRNSELQEDLLRQDNEELQKQCSHLEHQHNSLRRDFEQLQKLHGELLRDHEHLQILHEQLNSEYEAVKKEATDLRYRNREMKASSIEMDNLRDQAERHRKLAEDLKAMLSEERTQKDKEFKAFALLQNEHSELKRAFDEVQNKYDMHKKEMDNFQSDSRRAKTDNQTAQLRTTQLQGQVVELQEMLARKDLEVVKSLHKCEVSR